MADSIVYRNYGETNACETLKDFVHTRIHMDAALVGGIRDAALEYTWAVSDDGGKTYRNPTARNSRKLTKQYGITEAETSTAHGNADFVCESTESGGVQPAAQSGTTLTPAGRMECQ